MGILNRAIPRYIKTPDGKVVQQNIPEPVYIDDAFDPLFNKRATEYLNYKYGNPVFGTLGGFAEGVENAIVGQDDRWGILGPGMGILSGFGRTMDKAGDFIIGGLTEGINTLNNISPIGADIKPENPLHNIFVEDEDYTGSRLLAAMGNSMAKLAGNAPLDESDFSGLWNVPATGLELMTDPGILGGSLAKRLAPEATQMTSKEILKNIGKAPVKHTVGEIGQLLSNYDDLMAKVAWDATVPGLRPMLNNVLDKFLALTGNNAASGNQDVFLKNYDNKDVSDISDSSNALQAGMAGVATLSALTDDTSRQTQQLALPSSPPTDYNQILSDFKGIAHNPEVAANLQLFEKYVDDLAIKYKQLIIEDPELYNKIVKIKDNLHNFNKPVPTMDVYLDKKADDYINELETMIYDELSTALTGRIARGDKVIKSNKPQTEIGKRITLGTSYSPSLEELADDLDVQDAIDEALTTVLGPEFGESGELVDYFPDSYNVFERIVDEDDEELFKELSEKYLDENGFLREDIDTDGWQYRNDTYTGGFGKPLKANYFYKRSVGTPKYGLTEDDIVDELTPLDGTEYYINILEQLEDGTLPVPQKYFQSLKNKIDKILSQRGYVPSKVKLFQSSETRKNSGINFAKYTNKKFKELLKKHFGKEHVTADEFIKKFKESPYVQDFFKYDLENKTQFRRNSLIEEKNEILRLLKNPYVWHEQRRPIGLTLSQKAKVKNLDYMRLEEFLTKHNLHTEDEVIKYFDEQINNTVVKNTLEKQFDEAVKKFFNFEIIKQNGDKQEYNTVVNYLNSFEEFIDFIYKNFSKSEATIPNIKKSILNGDALDDFSDFSLNDYQSYSDLINTYGYTETLLNVVPFQKDLFKLGEDYYNKVSKPLTFKTKRLYEGPGEHPSYNAISSFNQILNRNSKAFLNPDGSIDMAAVDEFRQAVPHLQLKFSKDAWAQIYKPGEMDSLLNELETFLLNVKHRIATEKDFIPYKELNPYEAQFVKNISNDPIKYGTITSILKGAWDGRSPKNISIDEALKNIKAARKGIFYGDDLLRFMKYERPKYSKIDSSFIVNQIQESPIKKVHTQINESFKEIYEHLNNKTLSQEVVAPTTMNENITNNIINKVIGNTADLDAITDSVEQTIKDFGTPKQKRLFQVFNESLAVHKKAKGGDYATLRMKPVEGLLDKSKALKETVNEERVAEYFRLKDLSNDDIITADSFISELIAANGRILIPLDKKTQISKIKELTEVIKHNATATSVNGKPIVEMIAKNIPNSNYVVVGYKLVQDVNAPKIFSKLKFDSKSLKDLVIHKGTKVDLKGYEDLEELFLEAQGISENLSTQLGFTSFTSDYFKHAMSDNTDAGEWLNKNLYNDIDIDDLENLSSILSNLANNNGTFRIQPLSRSLRGNFADWNQFAPIFSTDLEAVMKSTFSKGIFDNVNFQSYVDLFVNDNFKIKHYARTTEDLKEILYAGYDEGLTGNLNNTLLVAPVYNETGRLIKFKRFDKFSEKGLTEALNNPDTILIPTNVLTPLDKILRKDAKMNSKVFQFINKYINIPFKFGTLMNPGFLVGNMGDAYFKQAVTMSTKYGTSLTEELANVSSSLKQIQLLNNKFDDIYRTVYLKKMFTQEQLEARPLLMMSDIVLKNKKANQEFKDWFKTAVAKGELSKLNENTIRIWLFINEATPATFRASSELGNLPIDKTVYNLPRTTVERILTGDPSNDLSSKTLKTNLKNIPNDWKTYGLFANNPLSAEIIKSSSAIEDYFRSASLLNDLKHTYGTSEIAKILHNYDFKEIGYTESMEALNIKMMEAINTMYSANFNYDDMPDLMDNLSTFIPFPTFFMKNLGYWLKIAMERPELIDNLINVQTGLWGDRDLSEDEFQAEAAGRGAIPMSVTGLPDIANAAGGQKLSNLFKGIFKPTPMNSMFSAFNLLNNPIEDIAFRLNPALTPITRHLQDEESVRYRPYSTNQYERNITTKNENFNELELMFHRLNPLERSIQTGLRTPGKVVKGEAQLSDFVPSIFQPDFSTKRSNKK